MLAPAVMGMRVGKVPRHTAACLVLLCAGSVAAFAPVGVGVRRWAIVPSTCATRLQQRAWCAAVSTAPRRLCAHSVAVGGLARLSDWPASPLPRVRHPLARVATRMLR